MKVKSLQFFFAAICFLCLTASGCLNQATPFGAAESGAPSPAPSSTTSASGDTSGAVSDAPPSSGTTTGATVAQENVLGPRTDSERIGETSLVFAVWYGEGLTLNLVGTTHNWVNVPVGSGEKIDLPLKVQYALHPGDELLTESGLQIRIVSTVVDAGGIKHVRYCDALTTDPRPDGSNILFSGLDVAKIGSLELYAFNPKPPRRTPTADFASAWTEIPAGMTREDFVLPLYVLGTIDLTHALELTRPLTDRPRPSTPGFIVPPEDLLHSRIPPAGLQ